MNLKKKVGPLPVWAWLAIAGATVGLFLLYRSRAASSSTPSADTVDPTNPLGLTYGQEASDQAAGIDPLSGATYASEQPAAVVPDTSGGGSSGAGSGGIDPGTGDPYGAEILAAINGIGLTDNTSPGQTFLGEVQDVIAGKSVLDQLFPPGTAPPAAPGTAPAKTSDDKIPGLPGTYKDSKNTTTTTGSGNAGATGYQDHTGKPTTVNHKSAANNKPKSPSGNRSFVRGKKH